MRELATIDPEFQRLIPPISPEEYTQLEANIIRDGCQEPLCFWDDILIDGHNRYKICTKHGLPYKTAMLKFDSREHVKAWIGERQLGRRNLSDGQRALVWNDLRAARSQITRAKQAAEASRVAVAVRSGAPKPTVEAKSSPTVRVREAIAEEAGIPVRMIRYAQEIAEAPQKIEKQVEAGKITATEAKKRIAVATEVETLARAGTVTLVDAKKLIAQPAALSFVKKVMAKAKAPTPVSSAVLRAAIREAKREDYNERVAESKPKALEGKYRIIYADPPWKYVGLNHADEYGHAEGQYDCLTDEELIAYKPDGKRTVKEMADDNSVLFLWVTSPLLERCFPIMRAWGFAYKSSFVWDKIEHNMGHYNSVRHEFLLIATKGSCTPDIKKLHNSVVSIKRTEHSRKPKEFRDMIEKMYDHGRKLQLFSRKVVPGWDMVGNEI